MTEQQDYYQQSIEQSVESSEKKQREKEIEKNIFEAVRVFETDVIESKEKRIKFLTKMNFVGWGGVVVLAVAIAGLTPLKESVPYLLRVDSTTGYVDKVEPYVGSKDNVNAAAVRYFLARFVENREGYEWFTVQSMYNIVESAASNDVFNSYKNYMLSEYSPVKKLAKRHKMQVKVNGITFLEDGTAQIRFTKLITENDGSLSAGYQPTKWIATLTYDFTKQSKTEEQRLVNPLGLNVSSYRVDSEVVK